MTSQVPSTSAIPAISEDRQDCPATTSNSPLSATASKAPDGRNPTPTNGEDWKLPSHRRDEAKGPHNTSSDAYTDAETNMEDRQAHLLNAGEKATMATSTGEEEGEHKSAERGHLTRKLLASSTPLHQLDRRRRRTHRIRGRGTKTTDAMETLLKT